MNASACLVTQVACSESPATATHDRNQFLDGPPEAFAELEQPLPFLGLHVHLRARSAGLSRFCQDRLFSRPADPREPTAHLTRGTAGCNRLSVLLRPVTTSRRSLMQGGEFQKTSRKTRSGRIDWLCPIDSTGSHLAFPACCVTANAAAPARPNSETNGLIPNEIEVLPRRPVSVHRGRSAAVEPAGRCLGQRRPDQLR
jgi:hypothetical protein